MRKVTGYGPKDRGSIHERSREFSLRCHIQTRFGVHPTSTVTGTGEQGFRSAKLIPLANAGMQNVWSFTSSAPHAKQQFYLVTR